MKQLRALCAAMMLLTALSVTSLAGEISTGVVSPAPPPPASATTTEPAHMTTEATDRTSQSPTEFETLVTEISWGFLQLLSGF